MTNKLTLFIFIGIYLISLIAGVGFADINQVNAVAPAYANIRQSSWILVRVDDMISEQPRLVSVWALFLTYSPGPQVFFKPLYSVDAKINRYPDLGKLFRVSTDRTVAPDFMNELNRLISHQSGMIILDNDGFDSFTNWFTMPSVANEPLPNVSQSEFLQTNTFQAELSDFDLICTALKNNSHPNLVSLPWKNLFPNHLVAHPTLQSLTNLWERLVLSDFDTHCEVIQVQ